VLPSIHRTIVWKLNGFKSTSVLCADIEMLLQRLISCLTDQLNLVSIETLFVLIVCDLGIDLYVAICCFELVLQSIKIDFLILHILNWLHFFWFYFKCARGLSFFHWIEAIWAGCFVDLMHFSVWGRAKLRILVSSRNCSIHSSIDY